MLLFVERKLFLKFLLQVNKRLLKFYRISTLYLGITIHFSEAEVFYENKKFLKIFEKHTLRETFCERVWL